MCLIYNIHIPINKETKPIHSHIASSVSWLNIYIYIYIYTNLSVQGRCYIKSIFKRSLTGLNSGFFFVKTSCKYQVCPTIYRLLEEE